MRPNSEPKPKHNRKVGLKSIDSKNLPVKAATMKVNLHEFDDVSRWIDRTWEFWTGGSDDVRNLALIIGGILAATVGLYLAYVRTRAADVQARTAAERQVTDSFAKAVELLGSDRVETRLGAIYALERIAKDSARDHWPIMETLTAFVREASQHRFANNSTSREECATNAEHRAEKDMLDRLTCPTDVAAAMTVLARREPSRENLLQQLDLREVQLNGVKLARASLSRAVLHGAHLSSSDLSRANLSEADLSAAELEKSDLSEANLKRGDLTDAFMFLAILDHASLSEANLGNANLSGASLSGANLFKANLSWADLSGADLSGVNLSRASLFGANLKGADLSNADLADADLSSANITDAIISEEQLKTSKGGQSEGSGAKK